MISSRRTVSIRHVILGVAVAVTVLLGVLGAVLIRQAQDRMSKTAETTMRGYARLVAMAHSQWLAESEVLLASLGGIVERGEVASGQCTNSLATILRRAKGYDTFLIAGPDGALWCAPQPINQPINLADRAYFKQVLATRQFAVGIYVFGRVSGKRALPLAYPLVGSDGEVAAVIIAGKQLAWFSEIVASLDLPAETHVALIDGDGATLAHYPGAVAEDEVPGSVRSWAIQASLANEPSVFVGYGHGSGERIHAFSPLGEVAGAGVVISLPTAKAMAPVHSFLVQATIALASALILSILLVLLVLRGIILTPLARLLAGTRAVRSGDLTWRTKGKSGGSTEMAELYQSFDGMLTELNFQEARIREQASELERSNTDLQSFAYTVSHDLREPLRTVGSFVKLIERRYADKLDDEGREFMHYVTDGAERMSRMLDAVLEFSRIGTRGNKLEPIELDSALDMALQALGLAISESGARIERSALPCVTGDSEQLARVFQNLLSNAIKFRKPDVPLEITIAATRVDGMWEIAITDNGVGLPAEGRDQLFVLFRRLVTRDKVPGEGVGLAVCKRIVERHGGTIRLESEPGEGATFRFTLPAT